MTMHDESTYIVESKGQLISKGLFGFFNSPKKRTKNVCPSRLGQKFEFLSLFIGRIEGIEKVLREIGCNRKLTFEQITTYNNRRQQNYGLIRLPAGAHSAKSNLLFLILAFKFGLWKLNAQPEIQFLKKDFSWIFFNSTEMTFLVHTCSPLSYDW